MSVTSALRQQYGLSRDTGVLVTDLDPQGPAAGAGLKRGDIITELQGKPIATEGDLVVMLRDLHAGDAVPVTVDRNGEPVSLTITVGERSSSTT
jgi:serine protease Do